LYYTDAKKISKDSIVGRRFTAGCKWFILITPVLLYDKYLNFFSKTLRIFPDPGVSGNLHHGLSDIPVLEELPEKAVMLMMAKRVDEEPQKGF
jgi:hypothetical protein